MLIYVPYLVGKAFDNFIEVAIVKNEVLHKRLKPEHLDCPAMPKLSHTLWSVACRAERIGRVKYQRVDVSGPQKVFE